MAAKCMKSQNSCQWKWVLNSRLFHFQLSKFSLISQDTERTYSLVPKHHSLSLQYNRTNSLIKTKCKACWKTGNIQDIVREGENLPCSLGGLVLLLQSQCLEAEDCLVRKDRESHSSVGETSAGEGWRYKSYGRRYTSRERQNWEWCKEEGGDECLWALLVAVGSPAGANEWGSIRCNTTLCWSEKQSTCFPASSLQRSSPCTFCFNRENWSQRSPHIHRREK